MDKLKQIISTKNKPVILISLCYLGILVVLSPGFRYSLPSLLFILGGICGIFLLDIAEHLIAISPSPYRSVLFYAGFLAVSLFVATSSGNPAVTGMVFCMYITMIGLAGQEMRNNGSLTEWFRMINAHVSVRTQQILFAVFIFGFVLENFLFIRQF